MTISLANRMQAIKPSATHGLAAKVKQLQAAGKDIINLTIGEPDFDTPESIKEAARKALRDGFTKYTAVDGIPGLKQAIIHKLAHENQLNFEPAQIVVSNGVKQAIYNLAQALLNPGDEVIIPAPYWVSYPDMVQLADAKPVFVFAGIEQHFKITANQLAAAITPRTRMIILNSPNNPTGMAYSKTELRALAEVLLRHPQIVIASDDMYEHILWTKDPFVNILNVCPELANRTVVFNGVSKSYAMTGWRIGYAAGPKELIAGMINVQSQSTSNPNSIAQVAAQAALTGDQATVTDMCQSYKHRHEVVYAGFSAIKNVRCIPADGTFYLFPSVQPLFASLPNIQSDSALVDYLLEKAGVAMMPGTPFGAPGYLRLSFVVSVELLQEALRRIQNALS